MAAQITRHILQYPVFIRRYLVCRHPVFLFFVLIMFLQGADANAQKAYLSNGKKKVELREKSWIGLTTVNDTIRYWGDESYSYHIAGTGRDSLTVRRPSTFLDTIVLENDLYENKSSFEYLTEKCFKENKVRYCKLRKILSYEVKSFAYQDLTSITYSVYTGRLDGCIFCILIPGVNIWWLIDISKRKEKLLDMKKWTIRVE